MAGILLSMPLVMGLACGSKSIGDPTTMPDAEGTGGAAGTGGSGGGTDASAAPDGELPCNAYHFGCACNTAAEGNTRSCSAASAAGNSGAVGLCCMGDGPCECAAFACAVQAANRRCLCGDALLAEKESMAVLGPDCGSLKGAPGITCCMEAVACVCSPNKCSFVGQEVPSCDADAMSKLWCSADRRTDSCSK
jgi:hypothetical protein